MEIALIILARSLSIWLSAVSWAMMARMILSLFVAEDNILFRISFAISEPAVIPVRAVMAKLGIGQNSPFDLSFTVTYLIILIVRLFLP